MSTKELRNKRQKVPFMQHVSGERVLTQLCCRWTQHS